MIIQTVHKIIGTQVIDHMLPIAQDGLPPEWDTMPLSQKLDFIRRHQDFEKPYAIDVNHMEIIETKKIPDYTF